jgi:ribosome maturation factor RimP
MAEPRERRPMGIEDCTALSRHLSAVLDVEDAVAGSYVLEVSSPGIDRPLVKRGDYERFMGHEAKIELAQPLDGRRRFRGRIRGLDGDALRVELSEGGTVELPLAGIAAAKLVLTDEAIAAAQKEGRV